MQARRAASHPERSPTPAALRVVARAWADGASGVLHLKRQRIELLHGEPADDAALQLVVNALYEHEAPRFEEGEHSDSAAPRLAPELWTAATRLADRSVLKGRAQSIVKPGPALHRAASFPLGPDTGEVLARCGGLRYRLADTVRIDKGRRHRLLDDLVALEILGLVEFAESQVQREATSRTSQAEQRLRSEWKTMQGDPWTALGCNPGMGRAAVDAAARRLASRYRSLSRDPRLSPKGRAMATKMLAKVLEARNTLRVEAIRDQPLGPFEQGLQEYDAGRVINAMKCFHLANQERYSPRHTAWLGYALYHDESRDLAKRQRKGRRMIEKALDEGRHKGDAGYLMAAILYEERELVRAWTYLDRVLGRYPDHVRARRLRDEVKRDLGRS